MKIIKLILCESSLSWGLIILIPRAFNSFCQHQESQPLANLWPTSGLVQHWKSVTNLIGWEYETTTLHAYALKIGPSQKSQFTVLTKWRAAFGYENDVSYKMPHYVWLYTYHPEERLPHKLTWTLRIHCWVTATSLGRNFQQSTLD